MSTTGRVATRQLLASYATWDPADQEPFRRLAGSRFLRQDGEVAVVLGGDGRELAVYPGWYAIEKDGAPEDSVLFTVPENVGEFPADWEIVQDPDAR